MVPSLKPASHGPVLAALDKLQKAAPADAPESAPAPTAAAAPAPAAAAVDGDADKLKKTSRGSSAAVGKEAKKEEGKGDKKEGDASDNAVLCDGKRAQREKDEKALKVRPRYFPF